MADNWPRAALCPRLRVCTLPYFGLRCENARPTLRQTGRAAQPCVCPRAAASPPASVPESPQLPRGPADDIRQYNLMAAKPHEAAMAKGRNTGAGQADTSPASATSVLLRATPHYTLSPVAYGSSAPLRWQRVSPQTCSSGRGWASPTGAYCIFATIWSFLDAATSGRLHLWGDVALPTRARGGTGKAQRPRQGKTSLHDDFFCVTAVCTSTVALDPCSCANRRV